MAIYVNENTAVVPTADGDVTVRKGTDTLRVTAGKDTLAIKCDTVYMDGNALTPEQLAKMNIDTRHLQNLGQAILSKSTPDSVRTADASELVKAIGMLNSTSAPAKGQSI